MSNNISFNMSAAEIGDDTNVVLFTHASIQYRCVIDIETTGLPECGRLLSGDCISYRDLSKFESCRLVKLSWLILDDQLNELERQSYIVKPEGFDIPLVSTLKSHGITHGEAVERGVCFSDLAEKLEMALAKCSKLIGYNLDFGRNVLMSELFRKNNPNDLLQKVGMMDECCIMMCGKVQLGLFKSPSLQDLARTFLSEEENDTKLGLCAKIYKVFERQL